MTLAIVTGANRGIGLELCRQLQERGHEVIGACRRAGDELRELGIGIEEDVDVTSEKSVRSFAQRLGQRRIDLLVHNAGVLFAGGLSDLDFEQIRTQFEVNSLGPLRVTKHLLPCLGEGSKLAVVTSMMGSMGDNESGGYYGYRMSKAAVNAAFVSLARDLAPRGIPVAILHPGYVRTRMTGFQGNLSPEESARGLLARIEELDVSNSGTFWHATGERISW